MTDKQNERRQGKRVDIQTVGQTERAIETVKETSEEAAEGQTFNNTKTWT